MDRQHEVDRMIESCKIIGDFYVLTCNFRGLPQDRGDWISERNTFLSHTLSCRRRSDLGVDLGLLGVPLEAP